MTTFEYYVVGLLFVILCVVFAALQEIIKRLGKANNNLERIDEYARSALEVNSERNKFYHKGFQEITKHVSIACEAVTKIQNDTDQLSWHFYKDRNNDKD